MDESWLFHTIPHLAQSTRSGKVKIREVLSLHFDVLLTLIHFIRDDYQTDSYGRAKSDTLRIDDRKTPTLTTIGHLQSCLLWSGR
jgi:hypothetical protein